MSLAVETSIVTTDQNGQEISLDLVAAEVLLGESYGSDRYVGNETFENETLPNLTETHAIMLDDRLLAFSGLINNRIVTIGTERQGRYRPALLVRALELSAEGSKKWITVETHSTQVAGACYAAGYNLVDTDEAQTLIQAIPLAAEKLENGEYQIRNASDGSALLATKGGVYEQQIFASR